MTDEIYFADVPEDGVHRFKYKGNSFTDALREADTLTKILGPGRVRVGKIVDGSEFYMTPKTKENTNDH